MKFHNFESIFSINDEMDSMITGFYLGFFVWGKGKIDHKKFMRHAAARERFFRPSRGVHGHAPQEDFEKDSVQDWLKSHF